MNRSKSVLPRIGAYLKSAVKAFLHQAFSTSDSADDALAAYLRFPTKRIAGMNWNASFILSADRPIAYAKETLVRWRPLRRPLEKSLNERAFP